VSIELRDSATSRCVVIGASHAGVTFAFALRKEGWMGEILLIDADPELPYHRPPLSKTYLQSTDESGFNLLKAEESYFKEGIELKLGQKVSSIDREKKTISLENGSTLFYDKLVLATGARPILPAIPGIQSAKNVFSLRTANDVKHIRAVIGQKPNARVVIIGGGYIGLETGASLKKLGASVSVLEREARILARVTTAEMSKFFEQLHEENGVSIFTNKNVIAIQTGDQGTEVLCSDGNKFPADLIVVGVGIRVNSELAASAGLEVSNGIHVDAFARSSDPDIYAIGDCTYHYNVYYDRYLRLECVQNAVDQAKIAASSVAGKDVVYDAIPWFWSDQYEVKLQIVGLSEGYIEIVVRKESEPTSFSVWYFQREKLLAVDAINHAKAYVWGTKFLRAGQLLDKLILQDSTKEFKAAIIQED
jgi:3-phenylpropionate/trans-cinnamate dioxygenase ferredoxin reductase component